MSDPVQQPEVEDVVSSIRRLVSGEAPPQDVTPVPEPDPFVLTPALRVGEDGEDGSADPQMPAPPEADGLIVPLILPSFAIAQSFTESDSQGPVPGLREIEAEAEAAAQNLEAELAAAQAGSAPADQAVGQAAPLHLEDAVPPEPVEVELAPDAVGAGPGTGTEPDTGSEAGAGNGAGTDSAADKAPAENGAATAAPSLVPSDALKAKIAAVASAVERTRGAWTEPSPVAPAPVSAAPVSPAMSVQDPAAEPHRDMMATPSSAPAPEEVSLDDDAPRDPDMSLADEPENGFDDDGFIDEDTLREMVVQIVREELQGALGTRITRNVRKLVRQEVQRMLAAQGLGGSE
ncbi:hypothetical protein [Chachezhania sediminis]|uniref:hypothetical protein n=1 Tax=Chachezhania sediminis TaxID=2599291 RepID=UPI00131A96B5|nr:hypothetical protein [Chachezhania sediminis]